MTGFRISHPEPLNSALAMLGTGGDVTASELRRKLAKLGCTFEQGRRHLVVIYKGKATEMPRHPAKEVKTGMVRGILKELGIKEIER